MRNSRLSVDFSMAIAISPETAQKKIEEVNSKEKEDQWIQVQK